MGRMDVNGGESGWWDVTIGMGRSDGDGDGDVGVVLLSSVFARAVDCVVVVEFGGGSGGGEVLFEGGSR